MTAPSTPPISERLGNSPAPDNPPGTSRQGRNLVICCDGTNNLWGGGRNVTNVVKFFERLARNDRQLTYYDPGVGTAVGEYVEAKADLKQRLRRMAGLAWGDGVWRNVADAYLWLMQNYRDEDRIYLVGFSRGAFTVRALAGLLHHCQLLRASHENFVPTLISAFRAKTSKKGKDDRVIDENLRSLREHHARDVRHRGEPWDKSQPGFPIELMVLFDTVESVGLGQVLLDTEVISDNKLRSGVRFARHALAIDEARWAFEPRLYEGCELLRYRDDANQTRLKQVLFPGVHSDVGGGYDESEQGLSDLVLFWMLEELENLPCPLELTPGWETELRPDPRGRRHDEIRRMPLWSLAGRCHREFLAAPESLHVSEAVRDRLEWTDWQPPWVDTRTEFELEKYGPKLGRALPADLRPNVGSASPRKESRDHFGGWIIVGLIALVAWVLACVLIHGGKELGLAALTLPMQLHEHLEHWNDPVVSGTSSGGDHLLLGSLLVLDNFTIALAALWLSLTYSVLSEWCNGRIGLGIRVHDFLLGRGGPKWIFPGYLLCDLLENAGLWFLSTAWLAAGPEHATLLGIPLPGWWGVGWFFCVIMCVGKFVTFGGTLLGLLLMAIAGLTHSRGAARLRWTSKLGLSPRS